MSRPAPSDHLTALLPPDPNAPGPSSAPPLAPSLHPSAPRPPRRPHGKARSVSSLPPPMRITSAHSSPALPSARLPRSPPPPSRTSASPLLLRHRSPTLPSRVRPSSGSGAGAGAGTGQGSAFASSSGSASAASSPLHRAGAGTRAMLSPSKLPPTECMSYFPPFESMGSEDEVIGGGAETGSGPADRACSPDGNGSGSGSGSGSGRSSRSSSHVGHGKGRSLGSLAGLMAWATFTPSPATTPSADCGAGPSDAGVGQARASGPAGMTRSPSDGEAVLALARRCSQTKRRVLEPMSAGDDAGYGAGEARGREGSLELVGERQRRRPPPRDLAETEGADQSRAGMGRAQKRRNGSEMEVDRLLRAGMGLSHVAQAGRGHSRSQTMGEDETSAVERIVGGASSLDPVTRTTARLPRPHLSLPPLSLPNWRFPIPSPPVVTLSPEIPIEMFRLEISNPASTSSSPNKAQFARADLALSSLPSLRARLATATATAGAHGADATRDAGADADAAVDVDVDDMDEVDEVDGALSPTTSMSSAVWNHGLDSHDSVSSVDGDSRPTTPDKRAALADAGARIAAQMAYLHDRKLPLPLSMAMSMSMSADDASGFDDAPLSPSRMQDAQAWTSAPPRDPYLLDVADRLKLRRSESHGSAHSGRSTDSKETLKARVPVRERHSELDGNGEGEVEGEVTPKAGKGWRAVHVGVV